MTQSSSAIFKENHVFNYKFLKIEKIKIAWQKN